MYVCILCAYIILFTVQLCSVHGSSTGQKEDTIIELRINSKKLKIKKLPWPGNFLTYK
jgi:hypothetical protein